MTDDPRLSDWLRVTQELLRLSGEPLRARLEAVEAAMGAPASLRASLEADPPERPSLSLAEELRSTERDLEDLLAEVRTRLSREIEKVRESRTATLGYRPTRARHPSYVSRSI